MPQVLSDVFRVGQEEHFWIRNLTSSTTFVQGDVVWVRLINFIDVTITTYFFPG